MCDDYVDSTSTDTDCDTSTDTSADTTSELPEDTGDLSADGSDELPDDSGEELDCENLTTDECSEETIDSESESVEPTDIEKENVNIGKGDNQDGIDEFNKDIEDKTLNDTADNNLSESEMEKLQNNDTDADGSEELPDGDEAFEAIEVNDTIGGINSDNLSDNQDNSNRMNADVSDTDSKLLDDLPNSEYDSADTEVCPENDNSLKFNEDTDEFLGFGNRYKDPNQEWNAERRDNINETVLPNADTEMKDYVQKNGLDRYIKDDKLNAKVTDNTKALTPREMQKAYGKGWNPSIMGFNDGKKSYVDSSFGAEQAKETAIHENFHQMSANDIKDESGNTIYRRGVSINGNDRGINEALTQKYTLDTMRATDPNYSNPNCAYNEATSRMEDLYSFSNNKDMFDQAYFQNDLSALQKHFDNYGGEGFYGKMSNAFNIATDNRQSIEAHNKALSDLDSYVSQYKICRYNRGDI